MTQAIVPIEQQTATPATKPARQRRISRPIVQAIELILTGEVTTQKAAANRVGVTDAWLSKMLQRDYVRVFCERRMRQTISAGTMRASRRLVELIDASSEHVALDATKHALAIHGIKPATDANVSVSIELKAGYVIDLSEDNPQKAKIIEHNQCSALPTEGNDR